MKRAFLLFMLLIGMASAAEEKKKSYDTFKLVKTRNIFDPNRRAQRPEPKERDAKEARTRANWIALTGTMVTDDRALAFFNSSRADARKVVGVGEKVGDFKILAVTPLQVEWERDGKRSVLAVGRQIDLSTSELVESATAVEASAAPTEENPAPAPAAAPPADGTDATSTAPAAPSAAPAPSNDKNEVLRRMMERRQKEMSK